MTHSESAEGSTAKYIVCVPVAPLLICPPVFIARKFEASEYAVFKIKFEFLDSGEFWRILHSKWLPESGYALKDKQVCEGRPDFTKYADIEVYGKEFSDGIMYIYAPIVKK